MDAKKVFSQVMLERHTNYEEIATKLGMNTQSLRNKISRGNYGLTDFIEMMDILECDVQVVTRDSKKVFDWWKKQSEYQAKYDAKNMKQYSVKYPIAIYKAVEKAMTDTGMNRNRWTTTAIVEKLERDGYI